MISAIGEILFDQYEKRKKLGGAPFNFIYHLNNLINKGDFISRIGQDSNGKEILNFLQKKKISTDLIQLDKVHPTGIAEVKLDQNKIPSFNIVTDSAYDFISITKKNQNKVEKGRILYVGTLAQRNSISRKTIQTLMSKSPKVFCDLNLRQNYYDDELINFCLKNTHILKINTEELKIVCKVIGIESQNIVKSAKAIIKKYSFDLLCITAGSEGSYIFNREGYNFTVNKIENIVDTVGAGDALSTILCIGYIEKLSIEEINKIASQFAAELCTIEGALPEDKLFYEKYKSMLNL